MDPPSMEIDAAVSIRPCGLLQFVTDFWNYECYM
jgi:hypothetical protein